MEARFSSFKKVINIRFKNHFVKLFLLIEKNCYFIVNIIDPNYWFFYHFLFSNLEVKDYESKLVDPCKN